MPDGSSSAQPVINPGPRSAKNSSIRFFGSQEVLSLSFPRLLRSARIHRRTGSRNDLWKLNWSPAISNSPNVRSVSKPFSVSGDGSDCAAAVRRSCEDEIINPLLRLHPFVNVLMTVQHHVDLVFHQHRFQAGPQVHVGPMEFSVQNTRVMKNRSSTSRSGR